MTSIETPLFSAGPMAHSPTYSAAKPALLFGDDSVAIARATALFTAAGVRIAGHHTLAAAADRLDQQVALGLVSLECSQPADVPSDDLLDRLARLAASGEAAVVATAPPSMIDLLYARLDQGPAQILIDPDDAQRAGALSVALAEAAQPGRVSDVGRDNAVRLRQLSDEMGRIASTLARLSSSPEQIGPPGLGMIVPPSRVSGADAPPLSAETLRSAIRARRLRSRFFTEELFADPAWDMLLDLTQAELAQHRVPVSSLCIAAAVPATTALRWIKAMTDSGLFVRRADPHDGRRVFVELSPGASSAMHGYFAELSKAA
jgi:hypothetical protein